jgi:hypothetical protein
VCALGEAAASSQSALQCFAVYPPAKAATMIRSLSTALLCALFAAAPALAETPVGDWTGVAPMRSGACRIAIHVSAEPDGVLVGTADSPDQGAFHVVLANVRSSGQALSFDLPTDAGHFEGRWSARDGAWTGYWIQGQSTVPLDLRRGYLSRPRQLSLSSLDGDWTGIVGVEASMRLRLTFHIRTDERGTTVVSENPDHLANGAAPETIARIGDHVILSLNAMDGEVQANLSDDGQVMRGALIQAGQQYPLMLTRMR